VRHLLVGYGLAILAVSAAAFLLFSTVPAAIEAVLSASAAAAVLVLVNPVPDTEERRGP
jgi:uncharacterized membrane protein